MEQRSREEKKKDAAISNQADFTKIEAKIFEKKSGPSKNVVKNGSNEDSLVKGAIKNKESQGAVGVNKPSKTESKGSSEYYEVGNNTEKKQTRKEKRPEMARYIPPGSRGANSGVSSSVASRLEDSVKNIQVNIPKLSQTQF